MRYNNANWCVPKNIASKYAKQKWKTIRINWQVYNKMKNFSKIL